MAKKTSVPESLHLTDYQYMWVSAACTAMRGSFEIPPHPLESKKEITYRQDREQRAVEGDLRALADLIRLDPYYLKTTRFVETVRVLRSERCYARILRERTHATQGLKLLADALYGITSKHGLKGKRPHPSAKDVSKLYELLLPAYRAAKRGGATGSVALTPYVRYGGLWRYFDARNFDKGDAMPEGMTPYQEGGTTGGKLRLGTPPFFTIPVADLKRLKSERPSVVALERVMMLLGIGRESDDVKDLTWARKLVAKGRKSMA